MCFKIFTLPSEDVCVPHAAHLCGPIRTRKPYLMHIHVDRRSIVTNVRFYSVSFYLDFFLFLLRSSKIVEGVAKTVKPAKQTPSVAVFVVFHHICSLLSNVGQLVVLGSGPYRPPVNIYQSGCGLNFPIYLKIRVFASCSLLSVTQGSGEA